jgi:hypothetical protein
VPRLKYLHRNVSRRSSTPLPPYRERYQRGKATIARVVVINVRRPGRAVEVRRCIGLPPVGTPCTFFDCVFLARWPCRTNGIGHCQPMTVC